MDPCVVVLLVLLVHYIKRTVAPPGAGRAYTHGSHILYGLFMDKMALTRRKACAFFGGAAIRVPPFRDSCDVPLAARPCYPAASCGAERSAAGRLSRSLGTCT